MTRANNVLKYQSLDQSLIQYIIQMVHSRTTLLFKYKTLQHNDETKKHDDKGFQHYIYKGLTLSHIARLYDYNTTLDR
jgi:hypothetical protein